eukprot:scaffold880_cov384-Prasinococcus_capsulatus_cf.AAC.18
MQQDLEAKLFREPLVTPRTPPDMSRARREVIVFYCEMSSHRAPKMQKNLRNLDRSHHVADYPALSYPHLFLLEGGYRRFYSMYGVGTHLCVPQGYVRMRDPGHAEELRKHRSSKKAQEMQRKRAKYHIGDTCERDDAETRSRNLATAVCGLEFMGGGT